MNWLNLRVSIARASEYVGSEPVQRATWLNVMLYASEQENSGRIVGAREWKDRRWQQTCGVTLAEVDDASPLLCWEGNDLVIWNYPIDKQSEIQVKREAGRRGGLKSHPKAEIDETGEAELEAELKGSLQRNRKEKEKEKEKGIGKEGEHDNSEPDKPASEPVMEFPCVGDPKSWPLNPEKLTEWAEAYPDMDVWAVAVDARLWCVNNPPRRKTAKGMPKFLNGWMGRSQDSGQHRKQFTKPKDERAFFESPHPDAFKPQHEVLLAAFTESLEPKAEAGDGEAAHFLEFLKERL